MATMDYSKGSPFSYRENKYLTSFGPDNGEYLMSSLDCGINELRIGICGDSTANASDEWFDLLMVKLGTRYPDRTITIPHWNDTNQNYDAPTLVQTGPMPSGIVFQDTFTRSGEVYGSTADIGGSWGRDGSNAMGDLLMDGTAAVSTSDTTNGIYTVPVSIGNHKLTSSITMSTASRGVGTAWGALRILQDFSSNYVLLNLSVSVAGLLQFTILRRVNGVQTATAAGTPAVASNTASVTFDAILERNGDTITATVAGTVISYVLTAAELAYFNAPQMAAIGRSPLAGDKYNDFKLELTGAVAPSVVAYNGSMSGSVLAYQQSRLDIMYPEQLDLVFVSAGHNYGSQTPAEFVDALDSFIYDLRVKHPKAGIIITSQNPQKSPASRPAQHLARQAVVRQYAKARGYGYMALTEKWVKQANKGVDLINTDGVHPILAGSQLWRDVAYDLLLTKSAVA